ncbi:BRO family protein [Spartinivicinus ruber]|uniref:BRO family protein n=1 Tax=Spartinivicinus ruber TaxID=2683272 RepID=UPI0013D0823A|nr:phage antirepressor KilAC domain-containing protein [Spartinivicinus ruber]
MNIIPFQFNNSSIRVIDKAGEPWFVAKDVAKLLGYVRPFDAIATHCKASSRLKHGEIPSLNIPPRGLAIIPERDVYRLIMRSKLPEAQKFEEWVAGDVLPSIRKTGGYGLTQIDWSNPQQIAGLLAQSIEKVQEQNKQIAVLQPKADFHDEVTISEETITVAEAAKVLNTGRNRLMEYLRQVEWINPDNEPYQATINSGYMDVKLSQYMHSHWGLKDSITPLITGKGLARLKRMRSTH